MLYQPLKALGLYSSNVPLYIKPTGNNDFYIFSAVGAYFLVYRFSNLSLIGSSDRLDENILSIAGYKKTMFCGCESKIYAFTRAKHVSASYKYEGCKNWRKILVLGDEGYLCGVSDSNKVVIWNIASGEIFSSLSFPESDFTISQLMQPTGYSKKILLTSDNGNAQLINYHLNRVIYTFAFKNNITAIAQTPNNDTIAFGCADGRVFLHNILYDKVVLTLSHDLGAVSSIAFRTDIANELILLAGTVNGHVTMWNVAKARNIGQTRDFHSEAVTSLYCISDKPLLVSSGSDNSIKVWNYDRPDGSPMLVRSRCGHSLPPSAIRFWPDGPLSSQILSGAGDANVRIFDTADERKELSMGCAYLPHAISKVDKKQYRLPGVTQLMACSLRDGFWDSVAACHAGHRQVTTWSHSKRTRGKFYLDWSEFRAHEFVHKRVSAERVALSVCGNFIVIGYSSGHLIKYNMQSGKERGQFTNDDLKSAHEGAVTGLQVGQTGQRVVVVSAGGHQLRMWDLKTREKLGQIDMSSRVMDMIMHPNGDMVAAATEDGFIHLVQLATFARFQIIRGSFVGAVTDMTFCHDSELLIVADRQFVKTFDYVNNKLVDCFKVKRAVTKVAMAPNDAFLVTTHRDDLGLYLWALRTHIVDVKLSSLSLDYETSCDVLEPTMVANEEEECEGDQDISINIAETEATAAVDNQSTPANEMLKLAGVSTSYLSAMSDIDSVRIRNANATRGMIYDTFFLPQITETLEGIKWVDPVDTEHIGEKSASELRSGEKKRKIVEIRDSQIVSVIDDLGSILANCSTDSDYDKCLAQLTSLSASSIDHEIRMLDPDLHPSGYGAMFQFLGLLDNQLKRGRSVELCQAMLASVLRHNMDCLTESALDEHQTGIDGLMDADNREVSSEQRMDTLIRIEATVRHMKQGVFCTSRYLSQIIEMAQFANNNL